jgi:hypothetical protein
MAKVKYFGFGFGIPIYLYLKILTCYSIMNNELILLRTGGELFNFEEWDIINIKLYSIRDVLYTYTKDDFVLSQDTIVITNQKLVEHDPEPVINRIEFFINKHNTNSYRLICLTEEHFIIHYPNNNILK